MPTFRKIFSILIVSWLAACGSKNDGNDNNGSNKGTGTGNVSADVQCGVVDLAEKDLRYCFQDLKNHVGKQAPEVNVIYYFHGLGGNETELFNPDGNAILQGLGQVFSDELPVIVSLSMGPAGVLGDDTREVATVGLPVIEALIQQTRPFKRMLIGGSLGGHNSLRLAAETPGAYAGIAALCPALATFNGHNDAEVAAYKARHAAVLNEEFFNRAIAAYRAELQTPEEWDRTNPFNFLAAGSYDNTPIYLSVGREDTLGFIEGAREFESRAQARPAMNVDYSEVTGGHCAFNIPLLFGFVDRIF